MSRPRLQLVREAPPEPLRFSDLAPTGARPAQCDAPSGSLFDHARLLGAIDSVSRRMEDLAREFNCLGYFNDDDERDDDDDDRPRAA